MDENSNVPNHNNVQKALPVDIIWGMYFLLGFRHLHNNFKLDN